MNPALNIWEQPSSREMYLIAGWRQWADAGSMSSGLPQYLIKQTGARQIGEIKNDGFYLFQFPGTHDLVRPVVKFQRGYPESLQTKRNEIFYRGDEDRGVIILVGDEPHLDVERYVISEKKPQVVYIPPGYANGFMSLTKDLKLVFYSTSTLEESSGDDIRYDARYWDIWDVVER